MHTIDLGGHAVDVAVAPDGESAYVVVTAGAEEVWRLEVVDLDSRTVVATYSHQGTGYREYPLVAIAPDGSELYLSWATDGLQVLDPQTGAQRALIDMGSEWSRGMAQVDDLVVSPDGTTLYVSQQTRDTPLVVDVGERRLSSSIDGRGFGPIAVAADGSRLFGAQGGTLIVVDTATNTIEKTMEVDETFQRVIGADANGRAYLAKRAPTEPGDIRSIDAATGTTDWTTSLTEGLLAGAVLPDGSAVVAVSDWSPTGDPSTLYLVNATTGEVQDKIPVGTNANAVEVTKDGSLVLVPSVGSDNLSVVALR